MLHWPKAPQALHASQFGHALFSVLRTTTAIVPEVSLRVRSAAALLHLLET